MMKTLPGGGSQSCKHIYKVLKSFDQAKKRMNDLQPRNLYAPTPGPFTPLFNTLGISFLKFL